MRTGKQDTSTALRAHSPRGEGKSSEELLDAEEAQLEALRKKVGCRYNDGVICGLWKDDPQRCWRCSWNPALKRRLV